MTAAGDLSIVASADLGSLGAPAGAPVAYHWDLPNLAPQIFPWLVILGLLALKPNRNGSAWLIWLPVICALVLTWLPLGLPSAEGFLLDAAVALAFGLAAVWLLANYLRRGYRLLTALGVLLVLGGAGSLELLPKQSQGLFSGEWVVQVFILGFGALASSVALLLAGWFCRRCFSPSKLYVFVLVSLPVIWLALTAPFFLAALSSSGAPIAWGEFLLPVVAVTGANFALLLPFLILSSANSLFRERLKLILHVQPPAPPALAPVAGTMPEAVLKT